MFTRLVLVILSLLSGVFAAFPDIPNSRIRLTRDDEVSYRLPTDTIPLTYDISLEPFFEPDFNFNGYVSILIQVVEETSTITLHASELDVDEDTILVRGVNSIEPFAIFNVTTDWIYSFLIIRLRETVPAGEKLEVSMAYVGDLNSGNRGFYRTSYVENGVRKWFGTTQFEPTSARRAFPCYDEPALKANFTIHITRPATYSSISNMKRIEGEFPIGDKFIDHFEESVKMSTYLVAFVVSEMSYVEEGNQAVYALPGVVDEGRVEYGLASGIKILRAMEEFTGVEYSLDKIYQVAIPNNGLSPSAMENWGLVTYREIYILYKEGVSTSSEKQNVAALIAHEYGHQWFGNLVSPLWWKYIWLNEGFATYFEHYAASVAEPTMMLMEQFVTLVNQYAMESDALPTSRPMNYDAQTPQDIADLFDSVAYQKSGAVIRMMEHFLTTETFKQGLNIYLNTMAYGAAQASDLWDQLQAAVDQYNPTILGDLTVTQIMDTWSTQAGYPLITVSRDNNNRIVLEQHRFLLNEDIDTGNNLWIVPISYVISSDPIFTDTTSSLWLSQPRETTEITIADGDWILLNTQSTGYYRVNYDRHNWNLIIDYLNSDNYSDIHVLSRSQLIDDAWNLARSGRLSYNVTLDLFTYLARETNYVPLYSFFRGLTFLHRYIVNSDEHYAIFKTFLHDILQNAYDTLGITDTGYHTDKLNRINVLTWLCRYEHEECLDTLHTLLAARQGVSPDLQTIVYCGGYLKDEDTNSKWQFLYDRYLVPGTEEQERNRIVGALGCTLSESQLRHWLTIIVTTNSASFFTESHRVTAISGIVAASKLGLDTAFAYILENFDAVTYTFSHIQIDMIFTTIANRLTTEEQLEQLQLFINSSSTDTQATYSVIFENSLNTIQNNIDWANDHFDEVKIWLEEYNDNNAFMFGISIPLLIAALSLHLFA